MTTFWPLNRVWVLASDDGGASWASHFVGGGPSLAVCEPTIVESGADDHVVAYMRSQYDTGFELYRSESGDGGLTWTKPSAAGLPNTSGSGCKPYIVGLRAGGYAMLLTNEHDITDRTNVSLFMTDEAGLRANEWRLVKTVSAECREHWLGAAYGWLADDPSGDVLATWVSYTATLNHLNFARLNADWLASTVIEPLGPNDQLGDDLPRVITGPECSGLLFPALRSRAHAPHLPSYQGRPYRLELRFSIEQLSGEFPVLDLRSCHGRHAWLKLELRGSQPEISPDGARNNDPKNANPVAADRASRLELWLHANSGGAKTQVRVGNDLELTVDVLNCTEARLVVDGTDLGVVRSASANPPATLYIGGNAAGVGACKVLLTEASYALLGDGGNAGEASS